MKRVCAILVAAISATALYSGQSVVFDGELNFGLTDGRLVRQFQPPYDWSKGELYRRVVVTDKPTDLNIAVCLCVWSGGEACSPSVCFEKPGDYYKMTRTEWWWYKSGPNSMSWGGHGTRGYVLRDGCPSGRWLATMNNSYSHGPSAAEHLPVKMKLTEIFVPFGETFECPDGWTDPEICGGAVDTRAPDRKAVASARSRVDVESLAGGIVRLSAPGARAISLVSLQGRPVSSTTCDQAGSVVVRAGEVPMGTYIARAATAGGMRSGLVIIRN